jgi:4-amino-4-deoxy-L-arabinose transferase-like glycosyltransferase
VYACVILFTKPVHNKWLLLTIGASLGLLALVRAQSLILVPLILLYVLIPQKTKKPLFMSSVFILFGLILVIAPWAWRNWNNTGTLALGDPGEKMLMARNYSLSPIEYPQPLAGETTADFSDRLSREIMSFVFEHPRDVAFFISNHFMHSLVTSAVYIAPAYSTDTPESLVSKNPFWDNWDGSLPGGSLPALLINLVILAIGISFAQRDDKLAGWYPFLVFVIYQAGNALARTSGWRFALPVDWITLMYFCIASTYSAVFLFLFLIGISVPLAERLIPAGNFDYLKDETKNILAKENILASDQFTTFLEQKNAVFLSGIALYPRYYKPDGSIYLANMPNDFRYLHFWLVNEGDVQIVLPREKQP